MVTLFMISIILKRLEDSTNENLLSNL